MKYVRYVLSALLMIVLMGGVGISAYTFISHMQSESSLDALLDDRIIISQDRLEGEEPDLDNEGSSPISDSGSDEIVLHNDSITEDQKVMEITTGTEVLEIPSLSMVVPIVEGTTREKLKVGAGHFEGTGVLGESGNYCLAGHSSSMFTCVFNGLENIQLYDEIHLYDKNGNMYVYYVTETNIVSPQSMYVLTDYGDTRVTLITCTDGGKLRFCVTALMMSDEQLVEYKKQINADRIVDMKNIASGLSNIQLVSFLDSQSGVSSVYRNFSSVAFKSYTGKVSSVTASKCLNDITSFVFYKENILR